MEIVSIASPDTVQNTMKTAIMHGSIHPNEIDVEYPQQGRLSTMLRSAKRHLHPTSLKGKPSRKLELQTWAFFFKKKKDYVA